MRTRSLVPKLKTMVIGLGARLAHVKSWVDQRSVRLVRSLPVVVAKAYAEILMHSINNYMDGSVKLFF